MELKNPQAEILRILLKGSILLGIVAFAISLIYYIRSIANSKYEYYGDSPLNILLFVILFQLLYLILKKGNQKFPAIAFVSTYIGIGFYASIKWGADIPFAYLIYSLSIVVAGIVMNGTYAVFTNIFIVIGMLIIIQLQSTNRVTYDYSWVNRQLDLIDGITFGLILSVVSLVSWLYNKEIQKSFRNAQKYERALLTERDNLEKKVQKRTRQLEKARVEKLNQMYKLAELGKISAGLIHELVNPLSSVTINLEQLNSTQISSINKRQIRMALSRAVSATKEMEDYVQATRKQIQRQDIIKSFSISKSINDCIKLFTYRSKTEKVRILTHIENEVVISGNLVKFHQVVNNLISNSLDALKQVERENKELIITLKSFNKRIIIQVEDNAKGIAQKELNSIFKPFYTTKEEGGTGIGLSLVKDIVENTFDGIISVKSRYNHGTTFTINIPTQNKA